MLEYPRIREAPFAKQRRGSILRGIERAAARDFHHPRKAPDTDFLGPDDGSLEAFSKREALLAWREIEAAREAADEEARARRHSLDQWAFGTTLESLELAAGRMASTRESCATSSTPSSRTQQA